MTVRVRRGRRPFGLRLYPSRELVEHSGGIWAAYKRAEAEYVADYGSLSDWSWLGPDALAQDVARFAVDCLGLLASAGPPPAALVDFPR